MGHTSLDIRFEGSKFYPSKLKEKTKLPIKILAEYGETSSRGRYKGKPSPYGLGILEISEPGRQTNIPVLIQEYCDRLLERKDDLDECGVDDIIFDIENSKNSSAEVSLSQDILRNLLALNARVEFHAISDDDDIRNKIDRVKSILPNLNKEELHQYIRQHPSIYGADVLYYVMFLFSKNNSSRQLDDNLNSFESFYNEMVKE